MYCSLFLRHFSFIKHYFFDKIAILTKLSATIWFKLLEPAYDNILPRLFKFPQNRRNVTGKVENLHAHVNRNLQHANPNLHVL